MSENQSTSGGLRLRAFARRLIDPPASFSDSLTGRIVNCIVISSLVALATLAFKDRFKEAMDAAVQSTLFQRLAPGGTAALPDGQASVVVIAIDDIEFREEFEQRSPLSPAKLKLLVDALAQARPRAVAIDLDMAPGSVAEEAAAFAAAGPTPCPSRASAEPRAQLFCALQALGRVTQGRTVLSIPQSYSTAQRFDVDERWLARFDSAEVRFATSEIDSLGLYYKQHACTLGVMTARLAASAAQSGGAERARGADDCRPAAGSDPQAVHAEGAAEAPDEIIRPQPLNVISYRTALKHPALLRDRIVVIGGAYGVSDRFHFRGVAQPAYGVMLHAWIVQGEMLPKLKVPESVALWIDICVGLVTGALFTLIWKRIADNRRSFARKSGYYLLFLALAIGAPAALIFAAVGLAQYGVFIGAAAMIVSVLFDSFFSSQERLMESAADDDGDADKACNGRNLDWRVVARAAGAWAWAVAAGVVSTVLLFVSGQPHWLDPGWTPWVSGLLGAAGALAIHVWSPQPAQQTSGANLSVADAAARLAWLLLKLTVVMLALTDWTWPSNWSAAQQADFGPVLWMVSMFCAVSAAAHGLSRRRCHWQSGPAGETA